VAKDLTVTGFENRPGINAAIGEALGGVGVNIEGTFGSGKFGEIHVLVEDVAVARARLGRREPARRVGRTRPADRRRGSEHRLPLRRLRQPTRHRSRRPRKGSSRRLRSERPAHRGPRSGANRTQVEPLASGLPLRRRRILHRIREPPRLLPLPERPVLRPTPPLPWSEPSRTRHTRRDFQLQGG
jgi:hypothetical protein